MSIEELRQLLATPEGRSDVERRINEVQDAYRASGMEAARGKWIELGLPDPAMELMIRGVIE